MSARIPLAVTGLAFLGILIAGCSWSYDVNVVNPCPDEIRIETYDDPPERFNDAPPNRGLYLPANSTTFVPGAFYDQDGHWSLRVVGLTTPLRVEKNRLEDETIEVSEDVCPFAWQPDTSPW